MTIRFLILSAVLLACGSKGGDDDCRRALTHAAEVYEASDAPAELKQQMRDGFEAGVAACRKENPPAVVLECTLAARTVPELARCDARRAGGDIPPVEGNVTKRAATPDAAPPDAAPAPAGDPEVDRGVQMVREGKLAEARALFEKLLADAEARHGPDHPSVASAANNLGVTLSKMGKHRDAQRQFERVVAIREKVLGPEHPALGEGLIKLARNQLELKQHAKALPLAERALWIVRQSRPSPRLAADAQFAFAEALWPSTPAEAVNQARGARDLLTVLGQEGDDLRAAIDTWLQAHPMPP